MRTDAPVDLRSDTVTRPTSAMRAVIAGAEVGDDGWRDDPSVAALERAIAEALGTEAALFVPSGTMANQIALRLHAPPGSTIVAPAGAHVALHEAGGAAAAGVQVETVGSRFEGPSAADLAARIEREAVGWPPVRLAWFENTLGFGGGAVYDPARMAEAAAVARAAGRKVHLDGARLWNAEAATGLSPRTWAKHADTVCVCLSKGLGAPVGSLLCGSADDVERARAIRQALGGTMRQAGLLAAAGVYALAHHRRRLRDDHTRARRLFEALDAIPFGRPRWPGTNMVLVGLDEVGPDAATWAKRLARAGVLASCNDTRELRFVTHLGIDDPALAEAIERITAAVTGRPTR